MQKLIEDGQSLVDAKSRWGKKIKTYDDGFGKLWIHRDSMRISGIVRAQTFEDAYSICEDEFFPAATDSIEEMQKEYSTVFMSGRELWMHEHNNDFETWQKLSEDEKSKVYSAPGKDVPFDKDFTEHPCWQESFGFRGNARLETDGTLSSIYQKDLNGDYLEPLTLDLLAQLEITLILEDEDGNRIIKSSSKGGV